MSLTKLYERLVLDRVDRLLLAVLPVPEQQPVLGYPAGVGLPALTVVTVVVAWVLFMPWWYLCIVLDRRLGRAHH